MGEVYSWGNWSAFSLGYPSDVEVYDPQKITFPPGAASIVAISGVDDGDGFYALDSLGNVYAWGSKYLIGDGGDEIRITPVLTNTNCKDILCGEMFGYVVKTDNSLWATGATFYDATAGSVFMNVPDSLFPAYHKIWVQLDPQNFNINTCEPYIIPIKFQVFSATLKDQKVFINWEMADQTNAEVYLVEHSLNGKDFSVIYQVNKKMEFEYSTTHEPNTTGPQFYRICCIENSGRKTYSEIKKVNLPGSDGVNIFPNPVADILNFSFSSSFQKRYDYMEIISADGKLIFKTPIDKTETTKNLDVSNWPKGIYIVRFINKFEKKQLKLIVN